jgi:RHS repeat-associated protein
MAHLLHEKSGSVPGAAEQASAGPIPKQPVYRTMLYFLLHELDCVHRLWGQYIDELIQLKALTTIGPRPLSAGSYYLLSDLLYRSAALTNSAGGIVEAFDTDAYGNTLLFSGPGADALWFTNDDVRAAYSACQYVFTGREYDAETQSYYFRTRYFSSTIGRFARRDAVDYFDSNNLYVYVRGRSASAVDPFGLFDFLSLLESLAPDKGCWKQEFDLRNLLAFYVGSIGNSWYVKKAFDKILGFLPKFDLRLIIELCKEHEECENSGCVTVKGAISATIPLYTNGAFTVSGVAEGGGELKICPGSLSGSFFVCAGIAADLSLSALIVAGNLRGSVKGCWDSTKGFYVVAAWGGALVEEGLFSSTTYAIGGSVCLVGDCGVPIYDF